MSTFVAFAFAAGLLLGQSSSTTPNPGNGIAHRVAFLTTLLSLTTSQQQQATTIFTNAASTAQSLHSSMKSAHQALNTAVTSNDAATIESTATTIGNLTAQLTVAQAKADAAFYQILTPEQQTKFAQLESQGHAGFPGPASFRGRH
jgi:Spy/CpxP family protein refolding chaperone